MLDTVFSLALATTSTVCIPSRPETRVLLVVTAASPKLVSDLTLARALIRDTSPFALASDTETREAVTAERGLRERRARVREARVLLARARASFAELEDRRALELLAEATPLLVAGQAEPEALRLLAQAHLLAGAVFIARGRLDAAEQRLQRALDIDPEIAPSANLRLLGALETVRARTRQRGRGWLEVDLAGTASAAQVFLDGRLLGRAPGRFDDLFGGRHLIRVSAPARQSLAGTLSIRPGGGTVMEVHLPIDETRDSLRQLGPRLGSGGSVAAAQEKLTERAGVDRTLLAAVVPASRRSRDGLLAPALILDLEGSGRRRVETLERASTGEALRTLADCEPVEDDPSSRTLLPAPPLLDRTPARTGPLGKTPPAQPVWRAPWFWALVALAAVGVAGGMAAAHGATGAPDDLTITLIPRP